MTSYRTLAAAVLAASSFAAPALAFSPIDISTANPGWVASFGAYSGPAFRYSSGCPQAACLSISSNGYADGTLIGGASAGEFTGTWNAVLDFDVPVHEGGVQLDLQLYGVDDRATFRLNGVPLITQHRQDGDYGATLSLRGGALVMGAMNRLSVEVVNAPFFGADPVGFSFDGDGTAASFGGTVSAVPEPTTWAMMAAGVGWMLSRRRQAAQG